MATSARIRFAASGASAVIAAALVPLRIPSLGANRAVVIPARRSFCRLARVSTELATDRWGVISGFQCGDPWLGANSGRSVSSPASIHPGEIDLPLRSMTRSPSLARSEVPTATIFPSWIHREPWSITTPGSTVMRALVTRKSLTLFSVMPTSGLVSVF